MIDARRTVFGTLSGYGSLRAASVRCGGRSHCVAQILLLHAATSTIDTIVSLCKRRASFTRPVRSTEVPAQPGTTAAGRRTEGQHQTTVVEVHGSTP